MNRDYESRLGANTRRHVFGAETRNPNLDPRLRAKTWSQDLEPRLAVKTWVSDL